LAQQQLELAAFSVAVQAREQHSYEVRNIRWSIYYSSFI